MSSPLQTADVQHGFGKTQGLGPRLWESGRPHCDEPAPCLWCGKREADMAAKEAQAIDKMTFEAALAELEGIVSKLERGDVELEESIAIYERGAKLKAHCEAKLKSAELKIEQIVQGANGEVKTEPASFD